MQEKNNQDTISELEVQVSECSEDTLLVEVSGKIMTNESFSLLTSKVLEELSLSSNLVCIDLTELTYINSNGLNGLISILTKTRTRGGEVVLFGITDKIQKLLLITKLTSVFSIANSKDEALQILSNFKNN